MRNRIYLDHAATTAVAPEVLAEMAPFFGESYGNPSAVYGTGREARQAVEKARERAAAALGAEKREIYFTSGGSESDNWALIGAALANAEKGKHIITSAIEHHAVLHACEWLERRGFRVTYLPVDAQGHVNLEELRSAIREDTVLVSVIAANNEIGTIEPVKELAEIAKEHGILFHTDAVQAIGAMKIDVNELGVDLLSLSGHKFRGPKGTGMLYVRKGTRIENLISGGAQERGMRAGTENVSGIAGLGKAVEMAVTGMEERNARVRALRDRLIAGLKREIPDIVLNGDPVNRLPGNCHVSVPGVDGEALILRLDLAGVAASGGSACTAGVTEESHVLRAIGQEDRLAKGSLRLTVGEENTEEEIDETIRLTSEIVRDLRGMT